MWGSLSWGRQPYDPGEHAHRLETRLPSVDELMDSWEQAWSAKRA